MRRHLRLFWISFLVMFFELTAIRWFPAHIKYLGYFSNFVLISSFFGIGLGCLHASRKTDLLPWFPAALCAILTAMAVFKFEVDIDSRSEMFFGEWFRTPLLMTPIGSRVILPGIFALIALLFAMLSQELGRAFQSARDRPLAAYSWNLLGSLLALGLFMLTVHLGLPALVWFMIVLFGMLPLVSRFKILAAGMAAVALGMVVWMDHDSVWSPYYRITHIRNLTIQNQYHDYILVNGVHHQSITSLNLKEPIYRLPYQMFPAGFKRVLIIGAGGGNDVAAALESSATEIVDAVEIDPILLNFGRKLHPARPYQDPRVRVHVTDGRAFLRNSEERYDLIVYALIDSLTRISASGNLRLENYLFTREAFESAARRLKPDGLFVVYNYFREPWLRNKIAATAEAAFDHPSTVFVLPVKMELALITNGGRMATDEGREVAAHGEEVRSDGGNLATDDWPFLYLRERGFPDIYIWPCLAALAFGAIALRWSGGGLAPNHAGFFLLGAGFMLLETVGIARMSLLFGTTWTSNAIVFTAILLLAWLANLAVAALPRMWAGRLDAWLPFPLLLSFLGVYFAPMEWLGGLPETARMLIAGGICLLPIFFAGILFSVHFSRVTSPDGAYAANLFGALAGGILEYASMSVGYANLILIGSAIYLAAILVFRRTAFAGPAGMSGFGR